MPDERLDSQPSTEVEVTVNGETERRTVEDRTLLVHFLRDDLGYTGVHQGCVVGKCGACTVIVNDVPVKSCMMYATQVDGGLVTTVRALQDIAEREGIAVEDGDDTLHPLQKGFKECHGLQCGFCTPGFILSGYDLLDTNPDPSREEIEDAITGNLCRCTGYNSIVDSIEWAADRMDSAAGGSADD